MLATSTQPHPPPHLLLPQEPERDRGGRSPMSPVTDGLSPGSRVSAVSNSSSTVSGSTSASGTASAVPAPQTHSLPQPQTPQPQPSRIRGLFTRKSQQQIHIPADVSLDTDPLPSPLRLSTGVDNGDTPGPSTPTAAAAGGANSSNTGNTRSMFKTLFAEGTRPASNTLRALGQGFPSTSSLRESARRSASQPGTVSAAAASAAPSAPQTPTTPSTSGTAAGAVDHPPRPLSSPVPALLNRGASSSRVHLVPPPLPHHTTSWATTRPRSGSQRHLGIGQSLLKGSRSTPALVPRKDKDALRANPLPKDLDDMATETSKKGGRHSLARLFSTRHRNVSAPSPSVVTQPTVQPPPLPTLPPPPPAPLEAIELDSPRRGGSPATPRGLAISSPSGAVFLHHHHDSAAASPTPRSASNNHIPSLAAARPLPHATSATALRGKPRPQQAMPNLVYSGAHRPHVSGSTPSLSPPSYTNGGLSMSSSSLQRSHSSLLTTSTSASLSQTSLVLPDTRNQLLSRDHYHLRFASTYVINLIAPALKTANFSKSARNMEVKRITEERLALLMRMERTWGVSWADAASALLAGSPTGATTEAQEAKLRACNITVTAKARERKVFVSAMRDGILFCFLFNRLFPSQPAAIQRVKVPKDDTRISANIDRFLSACREQGVPESEMFDLSNLDENSPSDLARVSRTVFILAQMASPSVLARANASSVSRLASKPEKTPVTPLDLSTPTSPPLSQRVKLPLAIAVPAADNPVVPSPPASAPRSRIPVATPSTPPVTTRSVLERPLRSSSSDLLARLQREAGGSSNASNTGTTTSAVSVATSSIPSSIPSTSGSGLSSNAPSIGPMSGFLGSLGGATIQSPTVMTPIDPIPKTAASRLSSALPSTLSSTPPLSPVRAMASPSTHTRSSGSLHSTPPTARPPARTVPSVRSQVSFGSTHTSVHEWSSSVSSTPSANHLAPLHERERTPSLVSTSSQVASSYSRSIRGSVPTILDEDNRPIDGEDDFDTIESGTTSSLSHPRRLSEQTLQDARRKIIGTLLTSTEDLTLQQTPPHVNRTNSLEEARGFALSQSLAALEGSRPVLTSARTDPPRLRPISRGPFAQSIEVPHAEEDRGITPAGARPTSELPPRPRIRRLSAAGKMYVPKRTNSPASPSLSVHGMSMINMYGVPLDPSFHHRPLTKEERRRSEENQSVSASHRIVNMRNHSMVNLPATSRRTSTLSQGSRDSMVYPSLQILNFAEAGQPGVRYQLGNCIGRGQFGSVYRSLNLSTGQMVAIKRIRLSGMKGAEVRDVMHEVELLKRLTHPGIVKYEGMSRDDEFLNIVLEFVENGSLGQTLRAFGRFNERLVASYVAQILEGLCYLHSEGVVHCDLKAANILSTKNGNVKLSDFGVSLNMRAVEHFAERASLGRADKNEVAGTPNWMAPEVIKLSGASPKSDIWSLGCTIIELLTGRPPYSDVKNSMTVLFRIVDDTMPPLPETSPQLQAFLKLCFVKDPRARPSAAQLFVHEWVRGGHADNGGPRPQDSLPFIKRSSQEPANRPESRRLFQSPPGAPGGYAAATVSSKASSAMALKARAASASLVDLHAPRHDAELLDTQKRAQMSMISLHSLLNQSRECLNSSAAKTHSLVKTRFAKSITCHVCLEGVKKAAYLCQNCGLITHSKCAPGANARCDVRGQLALMVTQQDLTVSPSSSRATSPQAEASNPISALSGRLFGRGNRSKASLLAAPSNTSLVEPASSTRARRYSSGAASSNSRHHEGDTVGSLRSRHSEASEEAAIAAHDRSTSLIRIDEDGPTGASLYPKGARLPSVNKVAAEPVEGGTPRRRASMRIRPMGKNKDSRKSKAPTDTADGEQKSECIIA